LFWSIHCATSELEARVHSRTEELAKANRVLQQEVGERERTMRALRSSEEHLAHQAFHDTLTGLPNRALFVDRLQRALARSAHREPFIGVLFF